MSQFDKEWCDAFPTHTCAPRGGSPDDGNGYFSQRLSYKDWFIVNKIQRPQQNMLENFQVVMVLSYVTSLRYPVASVVLLGVILIARIIFTLGYNSKGPQGRMVGAICMQFGGILPLFVMSFVSMFSMDPDMIYTVPPVLHG